MWWYSTRFPVQHQSTTRNAGDNRDSHGSSCGDGVRVERAAAAGATCGADGRWERAELRVPVRLRRAYGGGPAGVLRVREALPPPADGPADLHRGLRQQAPLRALRGGQELARDARGQDRLLSCSALLETTWRPAWHASHRVGRLIQTRCDAWPTLRLLLLVLYQ